MKLFLTLALACAMSISYASPSRSGDDTPEKKRTEEGISKKYYYISAFLRSLDKPEGIYVYSSIQNVPAQKWTVLEKSGVLREFEDFLLKNYPGMSFDLSLENIEGESFIKEHTEVCKSKKMQDKPKASDLFFVQSSQK